VKKKEFLSNEALQMAIQAEIQQYEFYMKMAAECEGDEAHQMFLDLAAEEKKHRAKLEDFLHEHFETEN